MMPKDDIITLSNWPKQITSSDSDPISCDALAIYCDLLRDECKG